jgi:hypothetical protein
VLSGMIKTIVENPILFNIDKFEDVENVVKQLQT